MTADLEAGVHVVRYAFADQHPREADLVQAARDSLIRYCRWAGLTWDWREVWTFHGTRWARCPGFEGWCAPDGHTHQVRPIIKAVRVSVQAYPRTCANLD